MKLMKPKFWENINFFSIILLPITFIVEIAIIIRKKLVKKRKFDLPIICIGNIYIGGTGKTPLAVFLGNELSKYGRNPAIIRKFYKNHLDEHKLIKDKFKYLYLNKYRQKAIIEAQKNNHDSIILDDGFQDYSIQKNLNIICFNQNQLIGNGLVFPSGPLRERLMSLRNSDIVIINGKKDESFEKKIIYINKNIKIFYSRYKPVNIESFKNKKLTALAGIGNPNNFFSLLSEYNLNVIEKLSFPDHYQFKKIEIEKIVKKAENNKSKIIITEKDYFKIKDFHLNNIECLKVDLAIDNQDMFIKQVLKVYD